MSGVNYDYGKKPTKNYRLDKPGVLGHSGPFVAEVMSVYDPTRMGRIRVWIESFSDPDYKDNEQTWFTARYMTPFYGVTEHALLNAPEPNIEENGHAYGMWFTGVDVGTKVLVVFAEGDPNQCYYIGCIPESQMNHMLPAIGAQEDPHYNNSAQEEKCGSANRVPVTEIDRSETSINDPQYTNIAKPVHSFVAGQMWKQGLISDNLRGPISSSAQRESPSTVFGFSTPGRPLYASGMFDHEAAEKIRNGEETDTGIVGRQGGHSFVMDDGDEKSEDKLIRIRTSGGHQLMMNDSGECMYFSHASGNVWLEFGKDGTIDGYAANSINLRTGGELNLHADKDINLNALENIHMYAGKDIIMEAEEKMHLTGKKDFTAYSKVLVGLKSDGTLHTDAGSEASFKSGSTTEIKASQIGLNHEFPASSVKAPREQTQTDFPDAVLDDTDGWKEESSQFKSIVSRAPTHEPYGEHGTGVKNVKQPK